MKRFAIFLAAMLLFTAGFSTSAHAKVRRARDLTLDEVLALQRSESRMATYDRALQALDVARSQGKISRREYGYEQRDLVAFIGAEARYQNDIMIDDRPFPPEDTRVVMENIAKYVVMAGEAIGYLALRIAPGFSGVAP